MHPYSVESNERRNVLLVLAVVSVMTALLVHGLLQPIERILGPYVALLLPSTFGLFGGLFVVFDRWGWRVPWLRRLGIVDTPDLSGRWTGYVESDYGPGDGGDDPAPAEPDLRELDARLRIHQRWTRIEVILETDRSRSSSKGATLLTDRGEPLLIYEYHNRPSPGAPESMSPHEGTGHLRLVAGDEPRLEGYYYTGPQRGNAGRLVFEKAT